MYYYNTIVVLAGVGLLGAGSGLVGALGVLRRRSLLGDALAHASLPGICLGFLVAGSRNIPLMMLGALASGVLGIVAIGALSRYTRIREDSSIGIVLSVFFGLGVVMSQMIRNHTQHGSTAGLESYILGKTAGMTRGDVYGILAIAIACVVLVVLLHKELKLVAFDADFAKSLGWPVYAIDLALMTLIALAVVVGLHAVGVVLIAAMLIMPGVSSRFWTDRFSTLLLLSGILGLFIGVIGTMISAEYQLMPAGPLIVLTGSTVFVFSLLFGTRRGLIARGIAAYRYQQHYARRQLLVKLFDFLEKTNFQSTEISLDDLAIASQSTARSIRQARDQMVVAGLANFTASKKFELTTDGLVAARDAARDERLWFEYLVVYPELSSQVDLSVSSIRDLVDDSIVVKLERSLKTAAIWPEIPSRLPTPVLEKNQDISSTTGRP